MRRFLFLLSILVTACFSQITLAMDKGRSGPSLARISVGVKRRRGEGYTSELQEPQARRRLAPMLPKPPKGLQHLPPIRSTFLANFLLPGRSSQGRQDSSSVGMQLRPPASFHGAPSQLSTVRLPPPVVMPTRKPLQRRQNVSSVGMQLRPPASFHGAPLPFPIVPLPPSPVRPRGYQPQQAGTARGKELKGKVLGVIGKWRYSHADENLCSDLKFLADHPSRSSEVSELTICACKEGTKVFLKRRLFGREDVQNISKFKNLRALRLACSCRRDGEDDVEEKNVLTEVDLMPLTQLPQLERLLLSSLSGSCNRLLISISARNLLRSLSLNRCSGISGEDLAEFFSRGFNVCLESLVLRYCENLDKEFLQSLPRGLQRLRVEGCPKISKKDIILAVAHAMNYRGMPDLTSVLFRKDKQSSLEDIIQRIKREFFKLKHQEQQGTAGPPGSGAVVVDEEVEEDEEEAEHEQGADRRSQSRQRSEDVYGQGGQEGSFRAQMVPFVPLVRQLPPPDSLGRARSQSVESPEGAPRQGLKRKKKKKKKKKFG